MFRFAAGIVTFNPNPQRLRKNIEAIIPQVELLIIVDNASQNILEWKTFIENDRIKIVRFNENLGIAKALNTIMEISEEYKFKWVLTLDDDSIIDKDFIGNSASICSPDIGIICPRPIYEGDSEAIFMNKPNIEMIEACMSSGSLTNLEAWKRVGGFDEWMFIDFVDNDFCKRLKLHGYEIVRTNQCIMSHQLGEVITKKLLWKDIVIHTHSNLRNYYMVRNQVYFMRKYSGEINIWWYLSRFVYMEICRLIFERERLETIDSFVKGLKDGFSKELPRYL